MGPSMLYSGNRSCALKSAASRRVSTRMRPKHVSAIDFSLIFAGPLLRCCRACDGRGCFLLRKRKVVGTRSSGGEVLQIACSMADLSICHKNPSQRPCFAADSRAVCLVIFGPGPDKQEKFWAVRRSGAVISRRRSQRILGGSSRRLGFGHL
jgi:hypothetical protein